VAPGTAAAGIDLVDTADIGFAAKGTAVEAVDTVPALVVDTVPERVDIAPALRGEGILPGVDIAEGAPVVQAEEPDLDPERIPVRLRQLPESLLQSTTPSIFVYASLSPFLQCSLAQLLIF